MKTFKLKYAGQKKHIFEYEIIKIEAAENYSLIYLLEGKTIIIAKTLKKFEAELVPSFFRINRSVLININFINSSLGDQVIMKNGQRFKVSRRRLHNFSILINKKA
jgi:two-component system LytT family response regulator